LAKLLSLLYDGFVAMELTGSVARENFLFKGTLINSLNDILPFYDRDAARV
jgi:hypothetical protein